MKNKNFIIVIAVVLLAVFAAWFFMTILRPPSQIKTSLANPASVNCTEKGGKLTIEMKEDGSEYGLCTFENSMLCEEWALMRGDCPVGGVEVTSYDSPQQVFCVISGGQTEAAENATCTFPNGTVCSVDLYYQGLCGPNVTPSPSS